MSQIKWIKLSTTMFDDEKIKLIEKMPEADTILVIWIKLLAQAGKTNASGYIYLAENIPFTDEMLSAIFDRPLNTVRMALQVFQKFGMIEITDEHLILIENWGKHQNVEGLDKIRQQTKERVARHREQKKLENVTLLGNVTVTYKEEEEEREEEEEKKEKRECPPPQEEIPFSQIVNHLNAAAGKQFKASSKKTRDLIKARIKEGFTLDDFKKVIDIKVPEWINDPKMDVYLRPETLFSNKFESYLNQKGGKAHGKAQAARKDQEYDELGF